MDAKQLLGWNLRSLRVTKGLSQEALALEAQIDRAYLGRVERGKENVTINAIEMLSVVLDVPVSALFRIPAANEPKPIPLRAGRKRRATT
jgi:transcriptional regulator with XRE-family HTH domain